MKRRFVEPSVLQCEFVVPYSTLFEANSKYKAVVEDKRGLELASEKLFYLDENIKVQLLPDIWIPAFI